MVNLTSKSDENHAPTRDEVRTGGSQAAAEQAVPLAEETASVQKREVVTGHVRVRTVTETLEDFACADVQHESVEVTRVPVDKVVETAPETRTEGDLTIVPVVEEVLVLEKRLVLKEELHIRRKVSNETVKVPVALRKQRAVVERLAPDPAPSEEETPP